VAILQALITWLSRSAGKALNAIFGWAVVALFGQPSPREQTMLSALVAAAAVWPLLALGAIVPKVALFVVAFVPLGKSVPDLWLRLVWIALALAVPIVVGLVVWKRAPEEHLPEAGWKKLLRGFPITIALAAAFLLTLVIAPVLKIASIVRRRVVVHVPAVMDRGLTAEAMAALAGALEQHGIALRRAEAPWHMSAPSKILFKLGGQAFAGMVSDRIEYRKGEALEVAVLANETLLRGKPAEVARAHALSAEVFAPRPVMQTFDARAHDLEKQIKRVWSVYRDAPHAHERAPALLARLNEIARDLAASNLPYEEWQVVYRLALQLDRALRGDAPLLEKPSKESTLMVENKVPLPSPRTMQKLPDAPSIDVAVPVSVEGMTNRELVRHVIDNATLLAKKEIELAKVELRADLKQELSMVKGLGVAGVCALCVLNLLLVAVAMALGSVMSEWGAALLVAAVVLAVGTVAGLTGWGKRVKTPLEATRKTLKEDAQWAMERLA
jgi:uncharacterized membrane protein YqjE